MATEMGKASSSRPYVTLTFAQSLDGSLATRRGEPLAISGPEALRMTHQLRAGHDALLVGIGTVLADDPQLTVRLVAGENPQPVVLDTRLRFPVQARLMGNVRKPWIVTAKENLTGFNASAERRKVLESQGAKVFPVPANPDGRVNLPMMLTTLYASGIKKLMVEGGAQVIGAFLRERLVDEVILTISPIFVGGLHAVETLLSNGTHFPRLSSVTIEPCGSDWIVRGKIEATTDRE